MRNYSQANKIRVVDFKPISESEKKKFLLLFANTLFRQQHLSDKKKTRISVKNGVFTMLQIAETPFQWFVEKKERETNLHHSQFSFEHTQKQEDVTDPHIPQKYCIVCHHSLQCGHIIVERRQKKRQTNRKNMRNVEENER